MAKLTARFQDNRGYTLHWFRMPDGRLISYRWMCDQATEKRKALPDGAVEVEDPFRKGAPLGGYSNNRRVYAGASNGN